MTREANLYRLQCLDSESDQKQRRLAEVEAALGESKVLRQARRALEDARDQVRKWAVQQRDLDLEVKGVADKISRSEQRLYGGTVRNPKELSDLQAEVAALRRRQQKLEDDLLEAMIGREEAETTQTRAQEHLDEVEAHWSAQQADLVAEREMLRDGLGEIKQAREALLPCVEASDLATYQALRRMKGGLAVVQVRKGACGGCGIAVTPGLEWQLRQEGLGFCSNCERMIVRSDRQ
jgi:predicted  nucleic acid-binding Zn-ribbon protein